MSNKLYFRDFSIFIGMWGLKLVKENNKVLKFCSMINLEKKKSVTSLSKGCEHR